MAMASSKRYKGKDCAYCGRSNSSSTNDHVVPRSFFLDTERGPTLELPQVAACWECNNAKSALEHYVGSTVLIGSRHGQANRYRQEKIRPRLERNQKLWNELDLDAPAQWVAVNGVIQPMHEIRIDAGRIEHLIQMIVRGLYRYHYGKPLSPEMRPDVTMIRPDDEAVVWASIAHLFPPAAPRVACDLGDGTVRYSRVQSPFNEGITAWVISLHSVPLFGDDGWSDHWWCVTRPTAEYVAAEKRRRATMPSPEQLQTAQEGML